MLELTGVATVADLAAVLRRLRLRQARAIGAHRVSYRALAKKAGWSHGIVGGYLSGTSLAPADRFDALTQLLGATPAEQRALATARDRVEELRRAAGPVARPVPRHLPPDVAGFTGRVTELAFLDALVTPPVDGVRIVSVTGTAGVGKTSLAVHWAHRWRARFPDGQLHVDLRGYDPGAPLGAHEALAALLGGLGIAGADLPADVHARAALFRGETADRRLLILLDNAATAEQVRPLLPGTASCLVLVTSRDSLAGLVVGHGAARLDLDLLPAADAERLLHALIGPRVDAEPDAARLLARRCARLPLALRVAAELAAARPTTTLTALAAELADERRRLDLLDAGGDSRVDVRAVFSWSLRQLSAADARVFGLLGRHPHTDVDGYATAALAGLPAVQARAALDRLSRKHLIRPLDGGRYGMHDLLRAYARDLSTVDSDGSLDRLAHYYLGTACAAMDRLYPAEAHRRPRVPAPATDLPDLDGPGAALAWLDAERACLIAFARNAAARDRAADAVTLSVTLFRYLSNNHAEEALSLHSTALDAATRAGDPAGQAEAHNGLGGMYLVLGRNDEAAAHLERALALSRGLGDHAGVGRAAGHLGMVQLSRGDFRRALPYHEQSLAAQRLAGYEVGEARALNNLGATEQRLGRPERAVQHIVAALAVMRRHGDRDGEAVATVNLGDASLRCARDAEAEKHYRAALVLFGETRNRHLHAWAWLGLGRVASRAGDHADAGLHHRRALEMFREVGEHNDGTASALNGLGAVALAQGRPERALDEHLAALESARLGECLDQEAFAHVGLGWSHQALGDPRLAREHWDRALAIYDDLGLPEADEVRARLSALGRTG
ncbi:hypothetical protein Val02_04190 [Virgisporangium aliadipatigenens]|uniref:Tetratricopeptide repeat protein n=1 Tax=Virgisporangium aliadipatigenens TaxID=741659 RepID=A0A8J3YFZ4_9ACTN|nr:tetratricopeptide repeat protein [Virgisporangium aliadipatigenens]GIJ43533.1 hypothetical protein Val02_04190 [Virgisporangium aliadipatigenens]